MAEFHKEDFTAILSEHGMVLNEWQIKQFAWYCEMLKDWNKRMNLTAIEDETAIYEKHFLDCILPMFDVEIKGTLCDVGSGAGFPSLPMKIIDPTLDVTIVEPLGKRITFLHALCEQLQLDVTLVNERSEDYAKDHREAFDIVTARAVANLPVLAELCIPLVKTGGLFIAMKGANALNEKQAGEHAIKVLGCRFEQSYERELSDGAKRITLVYEKVTKTVMKYPRNYGQIKKHPL